MIDHGRRDVTNMLTSGKQSLTKIGICSTNQTASFAAQISAKIPVLLKHTLSKSHVGAERGSCDFGLHVAVIKLDQRPRQIKRSIDR